MEQGNLTSALFINLHEESFRYPTSQGFLAEIKERWDITLSWFYDYLSNRNQVVSRQTIQKRKRRTLANAEIH